MATEVTPPINLLPPTPRTIPQPLAELPLPSEVKEDVERWVARHRFWRRIWTQRVEEELKLQYYYGGYYICCLQTPKGGVVVALFDGDEEAYRRQVGSLTPEERQNAVLMQPLMWNGLPRETPDSIEHES